MTTRQEASRPGATAGRAWSPLWLVASVLGVAVVAAIAIMKSGLVPVLPAKIALGVAIVALLATTLVAVGPDRPRRWTVVGSREDMPIDDAPLIDVGFSEADRVCTWRQSRLAALGVTGDAAALFAADTRRDVHELERLLAAGCPLATALRILEPV